MGNRPSQSSAEIENEDESYSGSSGSQALAAADCTSTMSLVSSAGGGASVGGGTSGLNNLAFAPSLKDVNVAVAAAVAAAAAAAAAAAVVTAVEGQSETQPLPQTPPPPSPPRSLPPKPPPPLPPPPMPLPETVATLPRGYQLPSSSSNSSAASSESPRSSSGSRPRICPIVQNGRQVTKDFYWVLPERRGRLARQRSLQEASAPTGKRKSSTASQDGGQQLAQKTPVADRGGNAAIYQNLPALPPRRACWSESSGGCGGGSGTLPTSSAGRLVSRVLREMPGVTEEESRLALGLSGWDSSRAIRYLKVEELFRLGLADRSTCLAELEAGDWRLDVAGATLLDRANEWTD